MAATLISFPQVLSKACLSLSLLLFYDYGVRGSTVNAVPVRIAQDTGLQTTYVYSACSSILDTRLSLSSQRKHGQDSRAKTLKAFIFVCDAYNA